MTNTLTDSNFLHRTDAGDDHFIHPVPEIIVEDEVIFAPISQGGTLDPANGRTDLTNAQEGWVWGDMFFFADGRSEGECVTGHRGLRTVKLAGELAVPLQVRSATRYPDIGLQRTWQYGLSGPTLPDRKRLPVSITGSIRHDQERCRDYGTGGWVIKFPEEVTAFTVTFIVNGAVLGQDASDPTRSCDIHHTEEAPERIHFRFPNFAGEIVGHMDLVENTNEDGCLITGSFESLVPVGGIEMWNEGGRDLGIVSVGIGTPADQGDPAPQPEPDPTPLPDPDMERLLAELVNSILILQKKCEDLLTRRAAGAKKLNDIQEVLNS